MNRDFICRDDSSIFGCGSTVTKVNTNLNAKPYLFDMLLVQIYCNPLGPIERQQINYFLLAWYLW